MLEEEEEEMFEWDEVVFGRADFLFAEDSSKPWCKCFLCKPPPFFYNRPIVDVSSKMAPMSQVAKKRGPSVLVSSSLIYPCVKYGIALHDCLPNNSL